MNVIVEVLDAVGNRGVGVDEEAAVALGGGALDRADRLPLAKDLGVVEALVLGVDAATHLGIVEISVAEKTRL